MAGSKAAGPKPGSKKGLVETPFKKPAMTPRKVSR